MNEELYEAINKFYKLKNEYENSLSKEKNNLKNNANLSLKERRSEFRKLKRKCISCNRAVGTIFASKHDADADTRKLIALCGDKTSPCNLDININVGNVYLITDFLKMDEEDIRDNKNKVIREKNDLLFGYLTTEEALAKFEKVKEQINEINSSYEVTMSLYNDIVDNNKKQEKIKTFQTECFVIIDNIKKTIQEFIKTNNTQYTLDVVDIYKNQLIPKLEELNKLKYAIRMIDYDEDKNIYTLQQKEYSIQMLEGDYGVEPQGIVRFVVGQGNEVKTKKPTITKKSKKSIVVLEENKEEVKEENKIYENEEDIYIN
jgi:hypothetical protein